MEENCGLEVLVVIRGENKGNRDPRNIVRLEADEQEGCAKRGDLQPPFSTDITPQPCSTLHQLCVGITPSSPFLWLLLLLFLFRSLDW